MVSKVEDATLKGEYGMEVSVNIEEAFGCVSFQKLFNATREHSVHETNKLSGIMLSSKDCFVLK